MLRSFMMDLRRSEPSSLSARLFLLDNGVGESTRRIADGFEIRCNWVNAGFGLKIVADVTIGEGKVGEVSSSYIDLATGFKFDICGDINEVCQRSKSLPGLLIDGN